MAPGQLLLAGDFFARRSVQSVGEAGRSCLTDLSMLNFRSAYLRSNLQRPSESRGR